MRLELVTGNRHKYDEFADILARVGCTVPLQALDAASVDETGHTYYQNAYKKARAGLQSVLWSGGSKDAIVVADDSGLELPEFGGIPGVRSARFEYADLHERAALTAFLRDHCVSSASARFVCRIVAFVPWSQACFSCEGTVLGHVVPAPRGVAGFGYDPLFIPAGYSITFAEMDVAQKNRISHRAQAVAQLCSYVQESLRLRP